MYCIKYGASNNSSMVTCVRCRGNVFTKPLPSNDKEHIHTDTDWWEGFTKYAVEMGSSATICVPSFIKIVSDIRKLMQGDTHTDSKVIS
jgi:hypothetical protein